MSSYPKRTDLSDREIALIHGGIDLKYVVLSNNDHPISPKQWKELMVLLEDKGYLWCNGQKPTEPKAPPTTDRSLLVSKTKELSFAQAHWIMRDFFITLDEFKKII